MFDTKRTHKQASSMTLDDFFIMARSFDYVIIKSFKFFLKIQKILLKKKFYSFSIELLKFLLIKYF